MRDQGWAVGKPLAAYLNIGEVWRENACFSRFCLPVRTACLST